ncbi:hypothetical protein jhhlp_001548 [Lomentospora prolificans]|uniref:Zn(2)-C6 fungal-type domain-containing protein n=1 Tax=Lomentospora prolificans TaxID=41688 RepID=A0A2N3NIK4_9PEZI|nr:hypothetical protein jhhlp_001548 [Lomentospora prolificans]
MDSDDSSSPTTQTPDPPQAPRPYHSKRPHRKSRTGCRTCKTRKVKCDEGRPSCRNCTLRQVACVYATARPNAPPAKPSAPSPSHASASPAAAADDDSRSRTPAVQNAIVSAASAVPHGPQFLPSGFDMEDMKLMWWYSTYGYLSYSAGPLGQPASVNRVLQVDIPQLAFKGCNRFLMDILLSMSACHMMTVKQDITPQRTTAYRARALQAYREAVTRITPETHPAVLAASLFLTAVAAQAFREEDTKELYILDWMTVWRGIGIFLQMSATDTTYHRGMRDIFFRPVLNLVTAAEFIPEDLSRLLASISEDDDEYPLREYHALTLKFLGALHAELLNGLAPITQLLILTWTTYLPQPSVDAMKRKQPYALIMLARYLPFLKLVDSWWVEGIADREVPGILKALGPEWADEEALRVPRLSLHVTDKLQLVRLLLNDTEWDFPPMPTSVQRGGEVVGFSSVMSLKTLPQRPKVVLPSADFYDGVDIPTTPGVGT